MAKEKKEKRQPILDDDLISELLQAEVENLPRNLLAQKMHVIEMARENGMSFKETAKFFTEKLNIPVKTAHIKEAYEKAHPAKEKTTPPQPDPSQPQRLQPQPQNQHQQQQPQQHQQAQPQKPQPSIQPQL